MVGQQLTPAQRAFLVLRYAETDHDLNRVRQEFLERFNRDPPSKQTILRNVAKYREHGTSKNLNQGRSGRPKTARSANNIQRVRESLTHNPRQSSRRNDLGNITKSSFNRIAWLDLKFHPYKIQRRHELIPADYQRRVTFCRWLLARPERFLSMLVIGDEATFKMNGCVSTHTVRYYASRDNSPRDFVFDVPHNLQKITVWIGMIGNNTIIGPHFFRGNVNSGNYLAMLNDEQCCVTRVGTRTRVRTRVQFLMTRTRVQFFPLWLGLGLGFWNRDSWLGVESLTSPGSSGSAMLRLFYFIDRYLYCKSIEVVIFAIYVLLGKKCHD